MDSMEEPGPSLVFREEDFPHGLRCAECHREMTGGERYTHRLSSFVGDTPVVVIVCVPCDLGIAS